MFTAARGDFLSKVMVAMVMVITLALSGCGGTDAGTGSTATASATNAYAGSADATSKQADPVSFSASTVSVAQDAGVVSLTVKRSGDATNSASVSYSTTDGTAVAGTDYSTATGTIQWAENDSTAKTVSVQLNHANSYRGNRSFGIVLRTPGAATAIGSPGSSTVTITGSSTVAAGSLGLSDDTYSVGQAAGSVTVTVNRTNGSTGAVSINYATANGTAVAGTDYTATNGTLQWQDGDAASKTFTVPVSSATQFSGSKTFSVNLSSPTAGATLDAPSSAIVTIAGTATVVPGSVSLSVATYSVGQSTGTLTVIAKRTGGSSGAVSVAYGTSNGTALAGTDYTAARGTLSWADGDTAPKSFPIKISNATQFSGNKSFFVVLSAPEGGATIVSPGSATVTIAGAATAPIGSIQLSTDGFQVDQTARSVVVTLARTGGTNGTVGVSYATTGGTAVAGTDFTAANGTVQWADGDASQKSFTVPISTATLFSGTRSFTVTLSGATGGATLGSPASGTVAITGGAVATPGTLQLSASSYSAAQGAGAVSVTVNRTGGSSGTVWVSYATTGGTAVAGTDFTATRGSLQWDDGDAKSKSFSIPLSASTFTGSKVLTVTLSGATGGSALGTPVSASVTIVGTAADAASTGTGTDAITAGKFGIKVSGNKFVSTLDGKTVQIIGDSVSGLETGMNWRFDQFRNAGTAFWSKLLNWNGTGINTVRLPLNEASWLNYTCYDAGTGASDGHYTANGGGGYTPDPSSVYQATVKQAVADATAAGLYVILDLHWSAPNNSSGKPLCPNGQAPYADADHSVAFWTQIADAFKNNPAVIFELFNEPFGSNIYNSWVAQIGSSFSPGPDALKLASGGSFSSLILQDNNTGALATINQTWNVAGMLTLLNAIRGEGATNVVLASPIGWAGEIETWLGSYAANGNPDPLKQFGVAWHIYGYAKGAASPLAVLNAGYPIAITETYGFDSGLDGGGDTSGYAWARANGIGFLCWGVVNDWGGQALNPNSTPPFASCPAP